VDSSRLSLAFALARSSLSLSNADFVGGVANFSRRRLSSADSATLFASLQPIVLLFSSGGLRATGFVLGGDPFGLATRLWLLEWFTRHVALSW